MFLSTVRAVDVVDTARGRRSSHCSAAQLVDRIPLTTGLLVACALAAAEGAWAQSDSDGGTTPFFEDARLTPVGASPIATSAFSIAGVDGLTGTLIAVGAVRDTIAGTQSGALYVYRVQLDGTWVQEDRVGPTAHQAFDTFGWSVAANIGADAGERVAVGATGWPAGAFRGAVYVFRRDPSAGSWVEEARIVEPTSRDDRFFGSAVAIDRDLLLVGVPRDSTVAPEAGAVYVFRHDDVAGTWMNEALLTAADGAAGDGMGLSIAVHRAATGAALAIVGSYTNALGPNTRTGAAYVFRREPVADGFEWVQETRLDPPTPNMLGAFGRSVGITPLEVSPALGVVQALAIVGEFADDTEGIQAGAAHVFARSSDGSWQLEQTLFASDASIADAFGWEARIAETPGGHAALIAAWRADSGTGAGYLFRRTPSTSAGAVWTETGKLVASQSTEELGSSATLTPSWAGLGAPNDDPHPNVPAGSGAAYVYRMDRIVAAEDPIGRALTSCSALAPNPFRERLSLSLRTAGGRIRVTMFDVLGRELGVLSDAIHGPGTVRLQLKPPLVAPGSYVVRIETPNTNHTCALTYSPR